MSPRENRIAHYALIGDLHTAGMVGLDGSIDWLCLPRFDSPACFAAMLDDESAGQWRLGPTGGGHATSRRYVDHTLVLETTWATPEGDVRLLDLMPPRGEAADVVRIVEAISGCVSLEMTLRLRFDYGRIRPWVRTHPWGASVIAGPDAAWLSSSVPLTDEGGALRARFLLTAGERATFVLTHQASHLPRPAQAQPDAALAGTTKFWSDWVARSTYSGPWPEEVERSLILLKALTYAPTGGIVAAATTSLPEKIGGVRNWDYRYCWLRDSTFTLQALLGTGYVEEARAWRDWLVRAIAGDPDKLQIMYGLDGRQRLPETQLDWLRGFDGSAPVRVGNEAASQFQLDVWGEVLDGLHLAREAGLELTHEAWEVQRALVEWLEQNWQRPDNGLWEVRGPQRQFVHSKVMAWVGLDRAVRTVEQHGMSGPVERWRRARDTIHAEVCEQGYDPRRRTFTQFYGSEGLDAALLLIPRVGFLPYDDERVVGTVSAVQEKLSRDGLLLRYDPTADGGADGLPGDEGVFLACSFWLADALHGIGRPEQADALFRRLLGLRNDVGLLSEEYDPRSQEHLGNTPQAFSLVGLVNTARRLSGSHTTPHQVGAPPMS